ncbi:hypothetical protein SAMN02927900_01054 [Rhizobium mongolense subsp. loessense]|uniref:Uncharacterized protein n=1 Tax=Rhizobium mongolense subsp. loessense TaxID=158890 RepID=A0A1G4PX57_9HYPH|nr:hypothetical protein SAMN02927900_01054 [Rhizobium mongolense subsp. loessense]
MRKSPASATCRSCHDPGRGLDGPTDLGKWAKIEVLADMPVASVGSSASNSVAGGRNLDHICIATSPSITKSYVRTWRAPASNRASHAKATASKTRQWRASSQPSRPSSSIPIEVSRQIDRVNVVTPGITVYRMGRVKIGTSCSPPCPCRIARISLDVRDSNCRYAVRGASHGPLTIKCGYSRGGCHTCGEWAEKLIQTYCLQHVPVPLLRRRVQRKASRL